MIKKVLSVLITGAFLLNLFGYYFIFRTDQAIIKEEMRGLIRSRNYKGVSFDIITVRNGDPGIKMIDEAEFLYHGKMYDIIETRHHSDSVTYTCINDTKEEKLIAGYHKVNDLVSMMGHTGKMKKRAALHHHLIKIALTRDKIFSDQFPTGNQDFALIKESFSDNFIQVLSPPPKG